MLWIKEVGMVDSVDELESSRSIEGTDFSNFEMLGELLLQEEGQSRGTESSRRRSVSSRKTDRLHDLRILPSHWRS